MIKKILITSIVFVLFIQNVFSQIELGVKGGFSLVNIASRSDAPIGGQAIDFDNKIKASFHFGGFGIYKVSEKVNIQVESIYTNKGTKEKEGTVGLHYLSIPVLVNYSVFEDLSLQVGSELGFLLAARGKVGGTSFNIKQFYDKSIDLTLVIGAKYQLNSEAHFGLRYGLGLSDLTSASIKFMNRGLHISVGYILL